ncbi:hypothetical protein EDD11_007093 [Mortierella claussenii]|nr:hypothetical protein EDD11_007093 [Mortierella claussenii]
MQQALQLPEILACIGERLSRADAIQSMRVSKAWKAELEPLLWRLFVYESSTNEYGAPTKRKRPTLALMQRNAHHIRRIVIEEMNPAHQLSFFCQCTQLEEITLRIGSTIRRFSKGEQLLWHRFSDMIRNHARLRKVVIRNLEDHGIVETLSIPPLLLNSLCTCPRLLALETFECTFDPGASKAYLQAIGPNIRRLASVGDTFPNSIRFPDKFVFQEMRYLDLRDLMMVPIPTQLDWMTRCPQLMSLHWEMGVADCIDKFCAIVPKACPHLTMLHLVMPLRDGKIAMILNAFPRIEKLSLNNTKFGPQAFAALRRHFPTLRDISLQHTPNATSHMLQEIMASCPNLQGICGEYLYYEDIVRQPWICHDLQMFDIGIIIEGGGRERMDLSHDYDNNIAEAMRRSSDKDKEVYARLAQLKKLKYLSICNDNMGEPGANAIHPILVLSTAGLFQLETLQNLDFFSCKGLMEGTFEADDAITVVAWMVGTWKQLRVLEGTLVSDYQKTKVMDMLQGMQVDFIDYAELVDQMDRDYILDENEEDEDDEYYDEDDMFGDMDDFEDYDEHYGEEYSDAEDAEEGLWADTDGSDVDDATLTMDNLTL